MLEVISTNVVETQAGENEGMQQDKHKALVRESNKIDGVTNCVGQNSWLTEDSR